MLLDSCGTKFMAKQRSRRLERTAPLRTVGPQMVLSTSSQQSWFGPNSILLGMPSVRQAPGQSVLCPQASIPASEGLSTWKPRPSCQPSQNRDPGEPAVADAALIGSREYIQTCPLSPLMAFSEFQPQPEVKVLPDLSPGFQWPRTVLILPGSKWVTVHQCPSPVSTFPGFRVK
jgi:hypothetical protein